MDYKKEIALAGLKIGAIKLNIKEPFTWTSGYKMPIYNDNRMFIFYPNYRKLIANSFKDIIKSNDISFNVVAGTSSAGISPATTLADCLNAPMIYVRDEPKKHGLKKHIEGFDSDLQNRKIILIEDVISTGGNAIRAINYIRDARGKCNCCFSIFNYGFDKSTISFENLNPSCQVYSILNYNELLKFARETKHINNQEVEALFDWKENPFEWGEKHGFPKIEK